MAKRLYPLAANAIDDGSLRWDTGTWKVSCLSSSYTYSDAHQFHSSLSGIVATGTIDNTVKSGAVWDGDDVTISGIGAGSTITAVVIWKDTGVSATSPLFLFDDSTARGLPFLTDGSDFTITWDNGPSRIFKITTTF